MIFLQLGDLWSSRPLEKFETVSRSVTVSAMVPVQKIWFDTVKKVRRPSELCVAIEDQQITFSCLLKPFSLLKDAAKFSRSEYGSQSNEKARG